MLIPVTRTEVQTARLRMKIDLRRGVRTPAAIVQFAGARRATEQEAADLRAVGAIR